MSEGKLRIGEVEVVGLSDATVGYPWPLGELFPCASGDWEQYQERYPATFAA